MNDHQFIRLVQKTFVSVCSILCLTVALVVSAFVYQHLDLDSTPAPEITTPTTSSPTPSPELWKAPDSTLILHEPNKDLILYGKELIAHTALYLGPNGKIKAISNGMNCQNCHLKGGTKPYGNNYAAVASTYPKFRARSGSIESVEKRVNDCIERSLNGEKLEENSHEMKALVAYINWVGKDVQKNVVPPGTGLLDIPLLNRAADPTKGKLVYSQECEVCHGATAQGKKNDNGLEWKYPPLRGDQSYNIGAGLYRLSRFAAFVKFNMPHGTTFEKPVLTDEEAWDVAAYINSLSRPARDISKDWPDISKKPFDHPFGPYADKFSELEHKFGPFAEIKKAMN